MNRVIFSTLFTLRAADPYVAIDVLYDARGAGRGHVARAAAILRRMDVRSLVLCDTSVVAPLDQFGLVWANSEDVDLAALAFASRPQVVVEDYSGFLDATEPERSARAAGAAIAGVWRLGRPPPSANADLVIIAEHSATGPTLDGVDCAPILLLDDDELLDPEEARRQLGVQNRPAILLGRPESGEEDLLAIVEASGVHCVQTTRGPLSWFFNGIDAVVGTPGYNLFHEARAASVPAAWVWRRGMGDQRLRCPAPLRDPDALAEWAAALPARAAHRATFANGAWEAAAALSALMT